MKLYIGKSKKTAARITLKQVMVMAFKQLKDEKINVKPDRFSDDSASWINIEKAIESINNGIRLDATICFDPETDNKIESIEYYMSEKLQGYDEENMKHLE